MYEYAGVALHRMYQVLFRSLVLGSVLAHRVTGTYVSVYLRYPLDGLPADSREYLPSQRPSPKSSFVVWYLFCYC